MPTLNELTDRLFSLSVLLEQALPILEEDAANERNVTVAAVMILHGVRSEVSTIANHMHDHVPKDPYISITIAREMLLKERMVGNPEEALHAIRTGHPTTSWRYVSPIGQRENGAVVQREYVETFLYQNLRDPGITD